MPQCPTVGAVVTSFVLSALSVLPIPPVLSVPGGASAGASEAPVHYAPPVDGAVVDPFRAPASPYAAGNRGLDYATSTGGGVRAAADGEVVFAGSVGGTLHVTLEHADGLRTSYSFLAAISVRRGERLRRGQPVGESFDRLHFGVRDQTGAYLDPQLLFGTGARVRARLVPGADEGRPALTDEPSALRRLVAERLGFFTAAGSVALDRWRLLAHYHHELRPEVRAARVAWAARTDPARSGSCTPADQPPPPMVERRVVVLVGGLGSTGDAAAVDRVDVEALGYAEPDVLRFSYAGGRVPDPSDGAPFASIEAHPYPAERTHQDLHASAAALRSLLVDVAATNPGVPVDVIAHSQGGVVASLALAPDLRRAADPVPAEISTLVTLASPLTGSDLATVALAARSTITGPERAAVHFAAAAGFDVDSPAVRQLAETSAVATGRPAEQLAPSIHLTSIAARGDLIVARPRSAIGDRPPVTVPLVGPSAHSELPGSPDTTREIALALARAPATCRGRGAVMADAVVGESVSYVTDLFGAGLVLLDATGPR
jgi:triacylglycerol esterase/lipase EstA (alpha/beta hydrolase family)